MEASGNDLEMAADARRRSVYLLGRCGRGFRLVHFAAQQAEKQKTVDNRQIRSNGIQIKSIVSPRGSQAVITIVLRLYSESILYQIGYEAGLPRAFCGFEASQSLKFWLIRV